MAIYNRVALDRGLRLAEKRCLPCPNRLKWLDKRDKLYEDIQMKGWKWVAFVFYCISSEAELEPGLLFLSRASLKLEASSDEKKFFCQSYEDKDSLDSAVRELDH